MYVPNYVPEPLEVPGNITLEKYRYRVNFIRKVVLWHAVSVAVLTVWTVLAPKTGSAAFWGICLVGAILAADFARIALRGGDSEWWVSAGFLLPILTFFGLLLNHWIEGGFPAWASVIGCVCLTIYTLVAGRDFSFPGAFALSWPVSSLIVFLVARAMELPTSGIVGALVLNSVTLGYLIFDLASLLPRRRRNEVAGAVADLYRDVFNIFGYVPRVITHWRKHRILDDLPFELKIRLDELKTLADDLGLRLPDSDPTGPKKRDSR